MSTIRYPKYDSEVITKRLAELEAEIPALLKRRDALAPDDPERTRLNVEAANLDIELGEIGAILAKPEERPGSMFAPRPKNAQAFSFRHSNTKPAR